jgi:hypothetical protein
MTLIKPILAFAVGFFLGLVLTAFAEEEYCYKPYGQPVISTSYVSNVLVTVNWIEPGSSPDAEAWSECEINELHNIAWCEVWVPRPLRPLGDPYMDALGHEVLHGLLGDFHK